MSPEDDQRETGARAARRPAPRAESTDDRVKAEVGGFDSNADAYHRARPSYPPEAVAFIIGHGGIGPGRRVLDLAAGTGRLTAPLAASGADVVAVEPTAGMRDVLVAALPDVEVFDAAAEDLPLPPDSIDAVTVGQAFHWFDAPVALAEIHRVLRDDGHLFLVWNTRDRRHDWVQRMGELIQVGERPWETYHGIDYAAVVDETRLFGPAELWTHEWVQPFDEDLLVARAESISVVGQMPPAERTATLDRIRELARTHPDLAGRTTFDFPYVTRVWHFPVA